MEQERWNPEQMACVGGLRSFFAEMEKDYPVGVVGLADLVGELINAGGEASRDQVSGALSDGNLKLGLAVMGDLASSFKFGDRENQNRLAESLRLGFGDNLKKRVGTELARKKFQSVDREGKIVLDQCVRLAERAVKVGISPRQVVTELVRDSVAADLTLDDIRQGSDTLRSVLFSAMNGHPEWIRETLGIEKKSEFQPQKKIVIPEPVKNTGQEEKFEGKTKVVGLINNFIEAVKAEDKQEATNERLTNNFLDRMAEMTEAELMAGAKELYPDKELDIALVQMYADMMATFIDLQINLRQTSRSYDWTGPSPTEAFKRCVDEMRKGNITMELCGDLVYTLGRTADTNGLIKFLDEEYPNQTGDIRQAQFYADMMATMLELRKKS